MVHAAGMERVSQAPAVNKNNHKMAAAKWRALCHIGRVEIRISRSLQHEMNVRAFLAICVGPD